MLSKKSFTYVDDAHNTSVQFSSVYSQVILVHHSKLKIKCKKIYMNDKILHRALF